MIKSIYMVKILMKQNIDFYLINEKVQAQSIIMILELLLNTQIIWIIFIKKMKSAIQKRKNIIHF